MTQPQDPRSDARGSGNVTGDSTPEQVNRFHRYSDKDTGPDSQHHSLGVDPNQSSPGDHNHDGANSLKIASPTGSTNNTLAADVGLIMMYPSLTPPVGWLSCNGAAVSRTTYANLFALISTTFGSGDGTTTFNLPNMQDRFPAGVGFSYAVGNSGGATQVTLDANSMPSHAHSGATFSSGDHNHPREVGGNLAASGSSWNPAGTGTPDTPTGISGDHNHSLSINAAGGGQAHENRPPYLALNFIIKT